VGRDAQGAAVVVHEPSIERPLRCGEKSHSYRERAVFGRLTHRAAPHHHGHRVRHEPLDVEPEIPWRRQRRQKRAGRSRSCRDRAEVLLHQLEGASRLEVSGENDARVVRAVPRSREGSNVRRTDPVIGPDRIQGEMVRMPFRVEFIPLDLEQTFERRESGRSVHVVVLVSGHGAFANHQVLVDGVRRGRHARTLEPESEVERLGRNRLLE
jgi:hypothetical protein